MNSSFIFEKGGELIMASERIRSVKEAATKLFLKQGYAKTQISHIAQAVGVSVGTIYHDFNGKPVFLRSTRKVPTFSSVYFFHLFHCPSIFPIFTANFQFPFLAFSIEKYFFICYNNSTL